MRAQALPPPHPPCLCRGCVRTPGAAAKASSAFRNYKIISRCPEEIRIRLRSVPTHDGAPVSRLKMSTCLRRPLREAPRIRAQEISSRGKTHSVMACRRPARDSLGAPTIFQTGGWEKKKKKKKRDINHGVKASRSHVGNFFFFFFF